MHGIVWQPHTQIYMQSFVLDMEKECKGKTLWLGTLFSASKGVHLLFTWDWARQLNYDTVILL